MFFEVDCIVCWEVTEEDEQQFKNISVILEPIQEPGIINPNRTLFPHATHTLRYNEAGITKPIYVIDMKKLLSQ